MQVSKEDALVVCQEFGFATADGWPEEKLVRKLGELVTLYRTGEFESEDDDVMAILNRIAKVGAEELEIGSGDSVGAQCPLDVDDRVVVREEGVGPWKGVVHEILSEDSVLIRDRGGVTREASVGNCEVKIRASEIKGKQEGVLGSRPEKGETEEEADIRSLRERITALRSKKKQRGDGGGKKNLRRDELVVDVLRSHPDGGIVESLAEEVDDRWKKQGRKGNMPASLSTLKRMAKAGVLFGLLKVEGRKVTWVSVP